MNSIGAHCESILGEATWVIERIHLIFWAAIFYRTNCRECGIYCFDGEIYYWSNLTTKSMLSRVQSADCLSDPRSAADAYEIYYATFIAIKSASYWTLLAFSKRALYRCRRRRRLRVPTFTDCRPSLPRDRDRIFGRFLHHARRPVASLWGVYTADGDEGRSGGRRPRRRKKTLAREKDGRRDARLSAGREGKRRRLRKGEVGGGYKVTRVQNRAPRARASERASARGEARLRFPRCLLAARPRRGSLACYSTLCSYAIRATLRLRKAWRNERPGRTRRGTDGERRRESEKVRKRGKASGRKEVEHTARWEREREENGRRGGEGGTTQQSCIRGALLISAFVHLRPPRWFVSAGLRETRLAHTSGLVFYERATLTRASRNRSRERTTCATSRSLWI